MKDKWDILQKRKKSCLRNIKQETIIQNDRKKKGNKHTTRRYGGRLGRNLETSLAKTKRKFQKNHSNKGR